MLKVVVVGTAMNVLDDWLPTLYALQETHPELEAQLFIPHRWILKADPTRDLEMLSEAIFSEVIVEERHGTFRTYKSIQHARKESKKRRFATTARGLLLGGSTSVFSARWQRERILLFDWQHSSAEGTLGTWFQDNQFMACFALSHGHVPNFHDTAHVHAPQRSDFSRQVWSKTSFLGTRCLTWPDGSAGENIGIPRHDAQWIERVASVSENLPAKTTTYISRPEDEFVPSFLPSGTREPLIAWLFQQCREHDSYLLVKRHPHEFRSFEGVLPQREYGNTWSFADQSALSILLQSEYVTMTQSNVALDAIAAARVPISLRRVAWSLVNVDRPLVATWMEAEALVWTPETPDDAKSAIWAEITERQLDQLRGNYERLVGPLGGTPARDAAHIIASRLS